MAATLGWSRTLLAGLVACTMLTVGCGGDAAEADGEPTSGAETAISYDGPIASTDTTLGAQLFETHCEGCHPGGAEGYGPALTGIGWDPASMRRQIREGEDEMPSFDSDQIADQDLEALLAHLAETGVVQTP